MLGGGELGITGQGVFNTEWEGERERERCTVQLIFNSEVQLSGLCHSVDSGRRDGLLGD